MPANRDPNRLIIFDTTLRDGEQSPGASMNLAEKLEIARALQDLGVDVIEAGFPIASPGDFEAVPRSPARSQGPIICGLARCNAADIDRAGRGGQGRAKPRIHVVPRHARHPHRASSCDRSQGAVLEQGRRVRRPRQGDSATTSSSRRGRRPHRTRLPVRSGRAAVIEAGATTLNIPDTVGYAMPEQYGAMIAGIIKNVPGIDKS